MTKGVVMQGIPIYGSRVAEVFTKVKAKKFVGCSEYEVGSLSYDYVVALPLQDNVPGQLVGVRNYKHEKKCWVFGRCAAPNTAETLSGNVGEWQEVYLCLNKDGAFFATESVPRTKGDAA